MEFIELEQGDIDAEDKEDKEKNRKLFKRMKVVIDDDEELEDK